MKRAGAAVIGGLLLILAGPLLAELVAPLSELAPVADLQLEMNSQVARLEKLLADESAFEKKKGEVAQAFGLLACLGQTLTEQEAQDVNGAALRDAALDYQPDGGFSAADEALKAVKKVLAGEVSGEHAKEHPWNKLMKMHPLMEEMNSRNSDLLRVVKRPRGKPEEPMHATTWVILGLAMKADTHEVKDEADIPQWNQFSDDFINAAINMRTAIQAKDKDEARKWFDIANETCDACHEKFRD